MRIRVIYQGKTKDKHLRGLEADYRERIGHFTDLVLEQIRPARNSAPAGTSELTSTERRLMNKLQDSYKIFLDGRGRELTSQEFAEWLGQQALRGRRELAFLVGAPDGFSAAFRKHADLQLALSRMTLTHDWARVLLLEQLYRGFTILRGYPYPR